MDIKTKDPNWVTAEDVINHLGLNKKKNNCFLFFVSGISRLRKYLLGGVIGICFEYVYRVESEVWYLPLGIGILLSVIVIIESFSNYR